jgi:hypothetical protein
MPGKQMLLYVYGLLIISLTNITLFAQIKCTGSLETGWVDCREYVFQDSMYMAKYKYPGASFYGNVNLNFTWKFITFTQELNNTFCLKPKMNSFSPIDIEYKSTINLTYKQFSIGYEHSCLHPVLNERLDMYRNWRRASGDRIFIKFNW